MIPLLEEREEFIPNEAIKIRLLRSVTLQPSSDC